MIYLTIIEKNRGKLMLTLVLWMLKILSTCLNFFLYTYLIRFLFNKTTTLRNVIIFTAINGLAAELPMMLGYKFSQELSIFTFFVIMIPTAAFFLNLKVVQSILSTCAAYIFSVGLSYLVMAFLSVIFQNDFSILQWANQLALAIFLRNLGNFAAFLVILCILLFKIKFNIPGDISKKKFIAVLMNCILTSIFIVPNLISLEKLSSSIPTGIFMYNSVLCILLLFINIFSIIKTSELDILRQSMETQKLYIKSLDEVVDKLRGFKHDFNNMVQVIGGYLSLNNIDGLKNYHRQLLCETKYIANVLPLNTYLMDNPPLYGLLLSKVSYAEVNEIQFNLEITCNIDIYGIKAYDFYKVLGILLDNALEAAQESGRRYTEIIIGQKDNKHIISISNTFAGEIDMDKIFENGYTTKSEHSGFGLWEIRKILSRYKNISLITSMNDKMITQQLEINLHHSQKTKAGVNIGLPL